MSENQDPQEYLSAGVPAQADWRRDWLRKRLKPDWADDGLPKIGAVALVCVLAVALVVLAVYAWPLLAAKLSADTPTLGVVTQPVGDADLRYQYTRGVWDMCVIMGTSANAPEPEIVRICSQAVANSVSGNWYDIESPGFVYPPPPTPGG